MLGLITHKWITVLHNHSLINGDGCGANIDVTSHKINAKINILKNILTAFFAPNYFPTLFLTTSFLDHFPQLTQLSAHANGDLSLLFVFESRNPYSLHLLLENIIFLWVFFMFCYALCHKTLTTLTSPGSGLVIPKMFGKTSPSRVKSHKVMFHRLGVFLLWCSSGMHNHLPSHTLLWKH